RADGLFDWSNQFGYREQVTGRYPPPAINSAYSPTLFWDGRAANDFRDPITNAVVIAAGGALESQAAGPPTSPAEMAHQGRDWNHVAAQIADAKPLILARSIPSALETWIDSRTYPELFDEAFGTPDVTPARIAMAIATFERTQFSDRSPHDRSVQQIQAPAAAVARGRAIFGGQGRCTSCHVGPIQSDNQFHYIGVRPLNNNEDPGRFGVTGVEADRGKFRTPGLRNVSLRGPFMHDGSLATLTDVVNFYNRGGDFNAPTKNPNVRPLGLNGGQRADLVAFLASLTDPRVQNETAPFDRPELFANSARAVALLNPGAAGSGGLTPEISAFEPPVAGNPSFTLGVSNGLGGANAILVIDASEPAANAIPDLGTVDYSWSTALSPGGNGQGRVSVSIPVADIASLDGTNLFGRWYVADPAAAGGAASSPSFNLAIFAPGLGNNVAVNNVQASDETSTAQIDVTWDPVLGAPSYRVWRHTSNDFGSATQIATPTTPSYIDTTPPNAEARFYWVTVDGDGGQTIPSTPDSGLKALEAPANLVASSDTLTEHITLGWDAVTGATGYRVHRGETADFGSSAVIARIVGTSHNDTTATPGRVFNYWIVAEGASTTSAPSAGAAGSRSLSAPTNVAASDGTFGHRVLITWDPSEGADNYAVLRNTANDVDSATRIGVVTTTSFDDTTVNPLENNFYWVRARSTGFQSVEGGPDTGNRTGDADGDSLEDSWELAFYGNLDISGPEDTDLDGWTVLEEYGFGADP
ncbi:MAG: cytochrome c peroxidase, partial [Verrucomicrobiota bacterium]